jgi:5,6,7,8-tetrahydromethanopterin hydro-lyase
MHASLYNVGASGKSTAKSAVDSNHAGTYNRSAIDVPRIPFFRQECSHMAADFFLGESLVGDGNEIAHIDLIIGSKTGPAGAAFCNALTNNKDGFTTLLAVVTPNLPAKPDTLMFNKVTIKGAGQAVQMFGPAQAAVARAVVDSVEGGIIPKDKADDYVVMVGVFIHWDAKDDQKIYDFNYQATKEAIQRAMANKPSVAEVIAGAKTAKHPFASDAERKHGVGV